MNKTEYIRTAGAYLKYSKRYSTIYNVIKPHGLKQIDYELISQVLDPFELVVVMGVMSDSTIWHTKILPEIKILCEYAKKHKLTFEKGLLKIRKLSDKIFEKTFDIQIQYRMKLIAENYYFRHRIIYDMRMGFLTDHFRGNKLIEAIRESVENAREALHESPTANINNYLGEAMEGFYSLGQIPKKIEVGANMDELLKFFTDYPYGKDEFYEGFKFTSDNVGLNLEIFDIDPAVILRKKLGIQP